MRRGLRRTILICSLACAIGAVGCGRWVTPVDEMNIRCDSNGECPTDFYCSESGSCTSNDEGGPPVIVFDGVRPEESSGEYADTLALPTGERTSIAFQLTNNGESDALAIAVHFESETCPAFNFEAFGVGTGRGFPAGQSTEADQVVEPTSECASPSEVVVRMETRRQESTGTFELTLE